MAISLVQKYEIARILGYPNLSSQASLDLSYPEYASQFAMWQPYAQLNSRLSSASAQDEVQYLGAESSLFGQYFTPSSAQIVFSTPSGIAAGVTLQANIGGTLETYVTILGDTPQSVSSKVATLIQQNPQVSQSFMANPVGNALNLYYIAALGTDGNGVNCMVTSSDPSLLATFGALPPSQFAFGATSGGSVPPGPQFTPIGTTETVFGFVPIIHILESDLANSRINLDTKRAMGAGGGSWEPRQDEAMARKALLDHYRVMLAGHISVILDPDIPGNLQRFTQRVV